VSTRMNLSGFKKFRAKVKQGLRGGGTGPIDNMLKAWGARYLTFVRRRYSKFSRGGGDWKPLAESTKKARRGGGKRRKTRSARATTKTTSRGSGKKFAILRNTGVLLKALTIGASGNLFKRRAGGIQVGFGGPAKHRGGKAKIADIAAYHNTGGKNLPKREILVKPDARTIRAMKAAAVKYVGKVGRDSMI